MRLPNAANEAGDGPVDVLIQHRLGDRTDHPPGWALDDCAPYTTQGVVVRDQQRAVDMHRHGGPTLRYDPRDARPNSRISTDARKKKPDLEGHTRPTEILKTPPTQYTFQRKGRLPQRVPPPLADGLDEKKIPAFDH